MLAFFRQSSGFVVPLPRVPDSSAFLCLSNIQTVQDGSDLVIAVARSHPADDVQRFHRCSTIGGSYAAAAFRFACALLLSSGL